MSHIFRNALTTTEPIPSEPARCRVGEPKCVRLGSFNYVYCFIALVRVFTGSRARKDRIRSYMWRTFVCYGLGDGDKSCFGSRVSNTRCTAAPIDTNIA